TRVKFRELFAAEAGESEDDGYLLDGDLLDLEPALRDALVLDLPLSPLCRDDCEGLCSRCGIKLADAEPGHSHPDDGGVWAVLKDLFGPEDRAADDKAGAGRPDGTSSNGTSGPGGSKEH
ncbi:MAG TPA: YceD family protein, partial [Gemmataceae bacterium]|nr:YceD family protein [Gemmataceae bacterium]